MSVISIEVFAAHVPFVWGVGVITDERRGGESQRRRAIRRSCVAGVMKLDAYQAWRLAELQNRPMALTGNTRDVQAQTHSVDRTCRNDPHPGV